MLLDEFSPLGWVSTLYFLVKVFFLHYWNVIKRTASSSLAWEKSEGGRVADNDGGRNLLEAGGRRYIIKAVFAEDRALLIQEAQIADLCHNDLQNFTLPRSPLVSFEVLSTNYTFLKCHRSFIWGNYSQNIYNYTDCDSSVLYYWPEEQAEISFTRASYRGNCSFFTYPIYQLLVAEYGLKNLKVLLSSGFLVKWHLAPECVHCYSNRGICDWNQTTGKIICFNPGVGVGAAGFVVLFLFLFFFCRRIRRRITSFSSDKPSRTISTDPYSKSELGNGVDTQLFSYKELQEATNNFDSSKELGDGGFGTVYRGKLKDGRAVAVKRLFENNYKRAEQFKNEIEILSRLRHPNLVTLYGCCSRHSRELLLVYEYVPNGTIADHLHGDFAKPGVLGWPTRLGIALEVSDALAYLHKVEIIHRDVKTNNILLDKSFHVKVADFGLSRLFPLDVTHVSTAPQGTPGYVDPEYHRCYQLTYKSDVYSFGVVLIELISSMPAVDITRHHNEINLASLAINKIRSDSLHELVDPTLGFNSDFAVRKMIAAVAELAFRCLQEEKEARPTMEEVSAVLREVETQEYKADIIEAAVTPADEAALLKGRMPPSPVTVTAAWMSSNTTPNISG
ncbi:hypothetical protein ACLOJK_001273 [Asimina triloba]